MPAAARNPPTTHDNAVYPSFCSHLGARWLDLDYPSSPLPVVQRRGRDNFIAYHERHMSLITWVVVPLMLAI